MIEVYISHKKKKKKKKRKGRLRNFRAKMHKMSVFLSFQVAPGDVNVTNFSLHVSAIVFVDYRQTFGRPKAALLFWVLW